jgi:hypothetical protein
LLLEWPGGVSRAGEILPLFWLLDIKGLERELTSSDERTSEGRHRYIASIKINKLCQLNMGFLVITNNFLFSYLLIYRLLFIFSKEINRMFSK